MVGIFRTPSQGDSISGALRKLLQGGWRGSQATHKFATKGADSLNIKDQGCVKELGVLCAGRCKPLGLLVAFLSYAPQPSGVKSCLPVHPKQWPRAASPFPQLLRSRYHQHPPDSTLGSPHSQLETGRADSCDISCLLIWQEIVSFHKTQFQNNKAYAF